MFEFKIETGGASARADIDPVIDALADHVDVAVIKLECKRSGVKNKGGIRDINRVRVVEKMLSTNRQRGKSARN